MTDAEPTAVHALTDVHDTALNRPAEPTGAGGPDWIDHLEPFQRSDSGTTPCRRLSRDPTATQNVRNRHETPDRTAALAATGCSTGRIIHRPPDQISANGCPAPTVDVEPIATQNDREAQDNAINVGDFTPSGVGMLVNRQAAPFQAAARNPIGPVPTAAQNPVEGHDTAEKFPAGTGGGDVACCTTQELALAFGAGVTSNDKAAPARSQPNACIRRGADSVRHIPRSSRTRVPNR